MRGALWALLAGALLVGQGTSVAQDKALRVVASPLEPCVFERGEAGFAIDLWGAFAERLERDYVLEYLPVKKALATVRRGDADVAIGCISLLSGREQGLDFTHPIAQGGLLPVSRIEHSLVPQFSARSEMMLLALFSILLFFANLMWWSERGRDAISDKYFPGVFQALWFSLVTMSTVGYGDVTPQRWVGRITASALILLGVTTFGVIFGQFAADATRSSVLHPVDRLADLRGLRVATKANTATVNLLGGQGVHLVVFPTLNEASEAVMRGDMDIVIHDAVALRYLLQKKPDLIAAGPVLSQHHLGFALQEDSQLLEPINRALLRMQEDGLHRAIYDRWF